MIKKTLIGFAQTALFTATKPSIEMFFDQL